MKQSFSILLILVSFSLICSCNSKGDSSYSNKEKEDTIFNDNIQGVFFDAPFGASKQEVINKFKAHGFIVDQYTSSDAIVHFRPTNGNYFTFGNMPWEMLDVSFVNDKFYFIRFMNASDDKATAIQSYKEILSKLSAKYNMMEKEPSDTTTYKVSVGYSKQNRIVIVGCYRYETISRTIMQGVSLEYHDSNLSEEISDEL